MAAYVEKTDGHTEYFSRATYSEDPKDGTLVLKEGGTVVKKFTFNEWKSVADLAPQSFHVPDPEPVEMEK